MKKYSLLLLLLLVNSLLLACSDQTSLSITSTPSPLAGDTLPPPSTPGPLVVDSTPANSFADPTLPSEPPTVLALPAPIPSRTAAPAPGITGQLPDLTNPPALATDPVSAKVVASFRGQGKDAQGKPEPIRAVAV